MDQTFSGRRYLIPFRAILLPQIFTDVLIVGAGAAGLRAAIESSQGKADVIVAVKGKTKQSNTAWAQGGIAAVMDPEDSLAEHIADTEVAGVDLCDGPVVKQVVEAAPELMRELIDWGMPFDRNAAGSDYALGREGGHGRNRILHSDGDATGKALSETLVKQAKAAPNVRLFDNCFVLDLITVEGLQPRCVGAVTHHPKYGLQVIWARATILATGGCGQVFRETTNPTVATGDGVAMAYRAGAELADMAFMQFHPTTLYVAGASRLLITEAVRGEGAHLIDHEGRRFMPDFHEDAELAPRDIVSRAILSQMGKTNHSHVYLDCRHIGSTRFAERFPGIFRMLRDFELDPGKNPIPIHPSAHYMIGGVRTDDVGRTNLQGLYAAGEVAWTGLHGANRLASNSLLESLVFGRAAGKACLEMLDDNAIAPPRVVSDIRISERSELDTADVRSSLRSVMWRHVGIEREGNRLQEVLEMFDFWARYTLDKIFDDRGGWEVQNLLTVGALITHAAQWREESRGTHYRVDRPDREDRFRVHDTWRTGQATPATLDVS